MWMTLTVSEKGAIPQRLKQGPVSIRFAGLPGFIKRRQGDGRGGNHSEPPCFSRT